LLRLTKLSPFHPLILSKVLTDPPLLLKMLV
jgi:hypothetical protein